MWPRRLWAVAASLLVASRVASLRVRVAATPAAAMASRRVLAAGVATRLKARAVQAIQQPTRVRAQAANRALRVAPRRLRLRRRLAVMIGSRVAHRPTSPVWV
jgi:hypothetical protein